MANVNIFAALAAAFLSIGMLWVLTILYMIKGPALALSQFIIPGLVAIAIGIGIAVANGVVAVLQ